MKAYLSYLKAELAEKHFLPKDLRRLVLACKGQEDACAWVRGGSLKEGHLRNLSQRCFCSQKDWTIVMNVESNAYVLFMI